MTIAYFLGGPADLTKHVMPDDAVKQRILFAVFHGPSGIPSSPAMPPEDASRSDFIYATYEAMRHFTMEGNLVVVYAFKGMEGKKRPAVVTSGSTLPSHPSHYRYYEGTPNPPYPEYPDNDSLKKTYEEYRASLRKEDKPNAKRKN